MPIQAHKNGVTRIFPDEQWEDMGKSKFGWIQGAVIQGANVEVNESLIVKKKVADVTKPVPDEIIQAKLKSVPDEIIEPTKRRRPKNVQFKK